MIAAARVPFLTREEEVTCFEAWHERKDKRARDRVIENTMPMARKYAAKWAKGRPLDDYEQVAFEGLVIAFEKYDVKTGNRFSTYAMWWVRSMLQRHAVDARVFGQGRSETQRKVYLELNRGAQVATTEEGLAEKLGLTLGTARRALQSATATQTNETDDLPSEGQADALALAVSGQRWVEKLIAKLNPRLRLVIVHRYLVEEPLTLAQVGEMLGGRSRERVRQIEEEALQVLRKLAECAGDRP